MVPLLIQSLAGTNRGLSKLLSGKSEKIAVANRCGEAIVPKEVTVVYLKDRSNNNAKRKEFFELETIKEEVYPNDPGFDLQKSRIIGLDDGVLG